MRMCSRMVYGFDGSMYPWLEGDQRQSDMLVIPEANSATSSIRS